ncbi:hypothetical protein F0562_012044 [Nyssa sinensis]|uniref:SHSP domain-containing protein n=1 Tax=Nyssa sinensis TaxID=561372 RepID=A0A5J4ZU51_9ASTE|nr:hypothetical protein F0562_012044 [Nyssa sinensis]
MASSRALTCASSLMKLLHANLSPSRATPFTVHFFNSVAAVSNADLADSDSDYVSDAVIHSKSKTYSVPQGQVCSLENPFLKVGPMIPYDVKQDNEATYARLDMPGIGKEGLKLWIEYNTLHVKGVELKDEKEATSPFAEESLRKYYGDINIPPAYYKMEEIKAELKNGVLMVKIPKLKLEEREDVINVKIDRASPLMV